MRKKAILIVACGVILVGSIILVSSNKSKGGNGSMPSIEEQQKMFDEIDEKIKNNEMKVEPDKK